MAEGDIDIFCNKCALFVSNNADIV